MATMKTKVANKGLKNSLGQAKPKPEITARDLKKQLTKSLTYQIWKSWDIVANTKSILASARPDPQTQVLELLRALAMGWVVLAHGFSMRGLGASLGMFDKQFLIGMGDSWLTTFIETGFYAVDIFLFLGGFVCIISMKRPIETFASDHFFNYWKFVFVYAFLVVKRYVRILPAYLIAALWIRGISSNLDNGPTNTANVCGTQLAFWNLFNFFEIPNMMGVGDDAMCMGWAWYINIDFQLYLTVPIIMLVHMLNKWAGIGLTSCLIVGSLIYSWLKASEMSVKYVMDENFFKLYYNDPISRACVYHAGCLLSQFRLKPISMNVSATKSKSPAQPATPGRPKTRKVENFSITDTSDLKKTTLAYNVLPTETQDSQGKIKQREKSRIVKH